VLGGHEDLAQARLTFADGCVADLSASRIHPEPVRRMRVWGPEGFAGVDYARRRLTLAQPAVHLGRTKLVPAELFGRHLQVQEWDCPGGDQLTNELQDFVRCVRTGATPRVDGAAGREAVALASAVLDALRRHAWEGDATGPAGPWQVPAASGPLFTPPAQDTAA
jgi:predicted dehydrogenase